MSRLRVRRRNRDDLSEDETLDASSEATLSDDDAGSASSSVEEDESDVSDSESEAEETEGDAKETSKNGENVVKESGAVKAVSAETAKNVKPAKLENGVESGPSGPKRAPTVPQSGGKEGSASEAEPEDQAEDGVDGADATDEEDDDESEPEEIVWADEQAPSAPKREETKPPLKRPPVPARESRTMAMERKRLEAEEYKRKLKDDPSFTPHVGRFWLHDDRFSGGGQDFPARGRGRGERGRGGFGGFGRGGFQYGSGRGFQNGPAGYAGGQFVRKEVWEPENDPSEKKWVHDKFDEIKDAAPRLRRRQSWQAKEGTNPGVRNNALSTKMSTPNLRYAARGGGVGRGFGAEFRGSSHETSVRGPSQQDGSLVADFNGLSMDAGPRRGRGYMTGKDMGELAQKDQQTQAGDRVAAPRTKRYLGGKSAGGYAESAKDSDAPVGETLKKAIHAPEFRPSTPSSQSSSHTHSQPSPTRNQPTQPPQYSHMPSESYPSQAPDALPTVTSYQYLQPQTVPNPAVTLQPMMTASGHIVLMTQSGLMVPADYGGYPMYPQYAPDPYSATVVPQLVPVASMVADNGSGAPSAAPETAQQYAYYNPYMGMYPQAAVAGAVGYYGAPMGVAVTSAPVDLRLPTSAAVKIRKPDEVEGAV
ncbi:hypothetical protein HK104_002665 [Borealophlyctis nickersoniae]|nr:hypothetical protein HK104_002665 [Borealophlyctis nickersoniae]